MKFNLIEVFKNKFRCGQNPSEKVDGMNRNIQKGAG